MHPDKAILNHKIEAASLLDIFSILDIKELNEKDRVKKDKLRSGLCKLSDSLRTQLGEDLFGKIQYSKEYDDLWRANKVLFQTISLIKSDETISAKYLYSLNYKRFLAKKALQEAFFGELIEQEVSYESN